MTTKEKGHCKFFAVELSCKKCGHTVNGFRGDKKKCPKCKIKLIESTIQKHETENIRHFHHADGRKN